MAPKKKTAKKTKSPKTKKASRAALAAKNKWASKEVDKIINLIQTEPFPSDKALEREHQKLIKEEKKLKEFLVPLNKLEKDIKRPIRRKKVSKRSKRR